MRKTPHNINANGLRHHVLEATPDGAPSGVAIFLHGFPDDSTIWNGLAPFITEAGYSMLAPDMRGFGASETAQSVGQYEFNKGPVPDVLGVLDELGCEKAHLVGHDLGACVAWMLAGQYPERFHTITALSVGHHRSFVRVGKTRPQRDMSLYILHHQFAGLCEWAYRRNDWAWFRRHWAAHYDIEGVIENLARPGRLTAGLNWYRANLSIARMIRFPPMGAFGEEMIRIPAMGVWSSGDTYLTEEQVTGSADFAQSSWRYERMENLTHWFPAEAPEQLAPLLLDHWRRR